MGKDNYFSKSLKGIPEAVTTQVASLVATAVAGFIVQQGGKMIQEGFATIRELWNDCDEDDELDPDDFRDVVVTYEGVFLW